MSRYIHLNPVRAKLVDRPQDWPWSSYRGYHRAVRQLPWLTYRRVLREFGRSVERARREYRRFVAAGVASMPPCPWEGAVEGLLVGGERFVERIGELLRGREVDQALPALAALRPRPSIERIVAAVAQAFGTDPRCWSVGRRSDDASRAVAAFLARRKYGYRATEVATALGYASHGGVVTAAQRIESADAGLRRTVQRVEKSLAND